MRYTKKTLLATAILTLACWVNSSAQKVVIDKNIATVGSDVILLSELEGQVMQYRAQGMFAAKDIHCKVLEEMLVQKLLINQAKIDSIEVTQSQVDQQLDQRLNYFISNIGSKEAVERYFNKTMYDIKKDLRDAIKKQMLAQRVQMGLVENIDISPIDITRFYSKIDKDSLPIIPEQYEIQQITMHPERTKKAIYDVKQKLLDLRKRIIDGERFETLAVLYSEDQGSATRGGELGFRSKNEFVKPFSDAAWSLRPGQVSNIVETEFGYHIIQVIDKKDDRLNTRHILMKPKVKPEAIQRTKEKLDSIASAIRMDSISFKHAAYRFSDDKKTYLMGGLLVNPYTNSTRFEKDQLPASEAFIIGRLKEGEVSDPFLSKDQHGKDVYKVLSIKSKIKTHTANIDEDYDVFINMAKKEKQDKILKEWIADKITTTFIKIDPEYGKCEFEHEGWFK